MQVAAITGVSKAGIAYQWFSGEGKIKHVASVSWEAIQRAIVF